MKTKYPRTFHLPWSLGQSDDDKTIEDVKHFEGKMVVVTEKMDGENTTLYPDGSSHARSIDSKNHVSRDWVKSFWAERFFKLPDWLRVCGENLYARHSIAYTNLKSYFMGFSVWEEDVCLGWDESMVWFEELGICPVRVIYRGVFDELEIKSIPVLDRTEGYVVRLEQEFGIEDFSISVAKFVRQNHVLTDDHWMYRSVERNGLKGIGNEMHKHFPL